MWALASIIVSASETEVGTVDFHRGYGFFYGLSALIRSIRENLRFLSVAETMINAGIFKTTDITELYKVEFRVKANNILNHRNYGMPDPLTEDAFTFFSVGSYQNPGFNNGGQR